MALPKGGEAGNGSGYTWAERGRKVKVTLAANGAAKWPRRNGGRRVIRGFVTGLVWGGIVAGAGLAVVSQLAPLPQRGTPGAAPVATPAPAATAEPVTAPEPALTPEATPLPEAPAEPTSEPTTEPAPEPAPVIDGQTPPDSPAQPEAGGEPATLPATDPVAPPATGPADTPSPAAPGDAPAATEPLPSPVEEPLLEPVIPEPAEPAPSGPKFLKPESEGLPGDTSRLITPDSEPLTDAPAASSDSLPRIGDSAATAPAPTPATPLDLFSRPFDNIEAKPLFAILLVDDGSKGIDRETLAALPFPVTFVIDPLAPAAAEAAALYRAGGQEVVMLANAIPTGATAADLEQSLQALDLALPDAVAVMGGETLAQDNQTLASALVPIIAAQGRGVVTMETGLNALEQVARRESVPTASVFRKLDAQGETVPVIRRYLDRAAFRAAQEGSVVVMGTTKPDTIAAILQWNVEGRAASVALAPISAVLRQAETE